MEFRILMEDPHSCFTVETEKDIRPVANTLPEGTTRPGLNGKKVQGEEACTVRKYLFQMAALVRWFMLSDFGTLA